MTELKWLEGYSGQSTEALIALEREYRADSLVLAFEQALDQKAARLGSDSLTEEECVVLAVEALEREVNNGGYDQFFVNTAEFVSTVVSALRRIGCPKVAALTQEAIESLGIEGPLEAHTIRRAIIDDSETRSAVLNACDERYFEIAGDLSVPLLNFVKRNRSQIRVTQ